MPIGCKHAVVSNYSKLMDKSPIQHISDTAFWVATYRALESERVDALFRDPLAARLVEGRGRAIAIKMGDAARVGWSVAIRTYIIDQYIQDAIAQGCDVVLNLGAGLDTRPYRMVLPPKLRWIEADLPRVLDFKEHRLRDEIPRCQLTRVQINLGDHAARRALLTEIDAQAAKVLVLTEGVLPYLSMNEVSSLATDLQARPNFGLWVVDYFSKRLIKSLERSRLYQKMGQLQFKFQPADWHAFFESHGWSVKKMRYLGEEGLRLQRPAPIPWWMKALARLIPHAKRSELQRVAGYALLQRSTPTKLETTSP